MSRSPQPPDHRVACPSCGAIGGAPCVRASPLARPFGWQRRGFSLLIWAGRRRLLVCAPRVAGFGNLLMDALLGLHVAYGLDATLLLARRPGLPNAVVAELDSPDVRVTGSAALRSATGWIWHTWEAAGALRETAVSRLRMRRRSRPDVKGEAAALAAVRRARAARIGREDYFGMGSEHYMRQLWAHHRVRACLPEGQERIAAQAAEVAGIPESARLVCLHVREPGWWPLRGQMERDKDDVRNADIGSYLPAIDLMREQGCTVVRLGHPAMRPINHPGVVDLATSPARTDLLEMWCVMRSRFLVTTASGPYAYGWLAGPPSLGTNVITQPIGAYPLRPGDRYLLKPQFDRVAGSELSLAEISTLGFQPHRMDFERYGFRDNSPEELLEAVREMLELDAGSARVAGEQIAFRERLAALLRSDHPQARRMRKGRPAIYLGAGLISRDFAEKRFDLGRPVPPAVPQD